MSSTAPFRIRRPRRPEPSRFYDREEYYDALDGYERDQAIAYRAITGDDLPLERDQPARPSTTPVTAADFGICSHEHPLEEEKPF